MQVQFGQIYKLANANRNPKKNDKPFGYHGSTVAVFAKGTDVYVVTPADAGNHQPVEDYNALMVAIDNLEYGKRLSEEESRLYIDHIRRALLEGNVGTGATGQNQADILEFSQAGSRFVGLDTPPEY